MNTVNAPNALSTGHTRPRAATAPAGHTVIDPALLQGARVRLRPWQAEDRAALLTLHADPHAMRFFPEPLSREASDAWAARCEALIGERGWGFWAAELLPDASRPAAFIGVTGLHTPAPELPFSPCVEVGWRLLPAYWGRGLAHEAASLALRVGFEALKLSEIVAFTTAGNQPSRALMERLGMQHSPAEDFEHPQVPAGHPLRAHVLYRLPHARWHAACNLDRDRSLS